MSPCCGRPNLVLAPTPLSLEELDPLSVTHGTSELKQVWVNLLAQLLAYKLESVEFLNHW